MAVDFSLLSLGGTLKRKEEVRNDLVEAGLDGGKTCLHAPFEQWQIILLAALVVPALKRGA